VSGVSAAAGLKSGQSNLKRNFEKANVEGMYPIYVIKNRINNPKKGIIPVGFRPSAGKRCVAASLVERSAGDGETQHDSI